jgi:hypothetical protein
MKRFLLLLFFAIMSFGKAFAQDTTEVEKEIPADSLNLKQTNDSLNTELKIEPTWEQENKSSKKRKKKKEEDDGYRLVSKAYYKEGDTAFIRKVKENIAYPAEARQLKFGATLIVKFLVRRDSTVGEVQVIEGFAEDTPPELRKQIEDIIINAVMVASPQGAWIAAQNNQNQAVAMTKKVPIVFVPRKEE